MVTFNENGFTVSVPTNGSPVENWLNTHNELVEALQHEDDSMITKRMHYLELLRNLMPDFETAQRLIPQPEKMVKQ
jgi:hypothetical protein